MTVETPAANLARTAREVYDSLYWRKRRAQESRNNLLKSVAKRLETLAEDVLNNPSAPIAIASRINALRDVILIAIDGKGGE